MYRMRSTRNYVLTISAGIITIRKIAKPKVNVSLALVLAISGARNG